VSRLCLSHAAYAFADVAPRNRDLMLKVLEKAARDFARGNVQCTTCDALRRVLRKQEETKP
jgi:hypothetical protein